MIYIKKVDLYRKSQSNSIYLDLFIVQIRIKSSRRVNRTAEIRLKKFIKRWFESDLKWNLAGGWLDRISLIFSGKPLVDVAPLLKPSQETCMSSTRLRLVYVGAIEVVSFYLSFFLSVCRSVFFLSSNTCLSLSCTSINQSIHTRLPDQTKVTGKTFGLNYIFPYWVFVMP